MVAISFDVNKLNSVLAEANRKNDAPSREYTKTAFLSEGKHTLRFFIDPDGNITREIAIHQTKGKKCLCPNWVNKKNATNPKWAQTVQAMCTEYAEQKLTKLPECEVCEVANEINDWRSGLAVKYNHMVYANLYETDRPTEYWVPDGNKGLPYAIIGKGKLKTALMSALESIAKKAPDFVAAMINPTNAAVAAVVDVVGGNQGYVNVQILPYGDYPAIIDPKEDKAPEWWRPLTEVFIGKDFNVDAYNEFVIYAEERAKELEKNPLPPDPNDNGGGNAVDPNAANIQAAKAVGAASKPAQSATVDTAALSRQNEDKGSVAPTEVIEKVAKANPEIAKVAVEAKATPIPDASKTVELAPDQRRTKMGRVVTLPDYAVERECWTKFNEIQDEECMLCPANLECMSEGSI